MKQFVGNKTTKNVIS